MASAWDRATGAHSDKSLSDLIVQNSSAWDRAASYHSTETPPPKEGALESLLIGTGRTFDQIGKGVQQLYYGVTGNHEAQDELAKQAQDENERYAQLQKAHPIATGIGESLPSMALAGGGGGTLGTMALRQAVAGAAPAALSYGDATDRLKNAGVQAAIGAALPVATAALKTVGAAVEPFFKGGQDKIVGRVLNRAAGDEASSVAASLKKPEILVPGSLPTAGEVSSSPGIAALQRYFSGSVDPQAFGSRVTNNIAARRKALMDIAGTPEDLGALEKARASTTSPIYNQAKKTDIEVTPEIQKLLGRFPDSVVGAGKNIANLNNSPFIMPGTPSGRLIPLMRPASNVPESELTSLLTPTAGMPTGNLTPLMTPEITQPGISSGRIMAPKYPKSPSMVPESSLTPLMTDGSTLPKISGNSLHYLKLGLDDALNIASEATSGIGPQQYRGLSGLSSDFNKMLEDQIPTYKAARTAYTTASIPINQRKIAQALADRLMPALADSGAETGERGANYAQALRNSNQVATQATGFPGATFENTFMPDQLGTINNVASDLARKFDYGNLGREVGSNTAQNFAMENIAKQSGMPSIMGFAGKAFNKLTHNLGADPYDNVENAIKDKLTQALLNPTEAAQYMQNANSKIPIYDSNTRELLAKALMRSGAVTPQLINNQNIQ